MGPAASYDICSARLLTHLNELFPFLVDEAELNEHFRPAGMSMSQTTGVYVSEALRVHARRTDGAWAG